MDFLPLHYAPRSAYPTLYTIRRKNHHAHHPDYRGQTPLPAQTVSAASFSGVPLTSLGKRFPKPPALPPGSQFEYEERYTPDPVPGALDLARRAMNENRLLTSRFLYMNAEYHFLIQLTIKIDHEFHNADWLIAEVKDRQSKLSQSELNQLQKDTHFDKKELQQWYKGEL